ncbi:MAG: glycoside hydrolase family 88 protein [Anaerolineae bacterium]|nr:glycoside hydrolase family 88 protein [Anaerolineae bacterium]
MNWAIRMSDSTMQRNPNPGRKWAYEWGVVLKGILSVWQQTGEQRYFDYIQHGVDQYVQPDGTIESYRLTDYNIDNINPGKLLFPLLEETGDARYETAIRTLRRQLQEHPRTNSGGFWHKKLYPYQMWLDGIYMAGPFYAQFAATFDEPAIFDDLAHQIKLITEHTRDEATGLFVHGWDETRQRIWADPETGKSPHFWGRAMGWFAMALVDVLDYFPPDHPDYPTIRAILRDALDALIRVQRDGVWYQILDQPEREGNYREASASCMIVYAIAKAVRCGHVPPAYAEAARKGFAGIIETFIEVDAEGLVNLNHICSVAGLGGTPFRDGTFEYYISEPIVTNDNKGVGAFILASAEMALIE